MGSGVSKTVHIDRSEYHFETSLYPLGVDNIRYFFDLIFGILLLYKGVLVRALNLHRDQKSLTRTGETWEIP